MDLIIVSDAWHPQLNGVVRTLDKTIACLKARGWRVIVIAPDQFRTIPCPTYPDIPLALAILPGLPHSKEVALAAHSRGAVVMLHLPMEPKSGEANPGPGALTTAQDSVEIERLFDDALQWAPGAQGVNNHMGSRFTEDTERMKAVLTLIKRRGLFFVDSRTSPESAGFSLAREMALPTAQRDVFLDNERDVAAITGQIEELFKKAARRGHAVGIGHPYPETLEALRRALPRLHERGARVVPVTALLVEEGRAAAAR